MVTSLSSCCFKYIPNSQKISINRATFQTLFLFHPIICPFINPSSKSLYLLSFHFSTSFHDLLPLHYIFHWCLQYSLSSAMLHYFSFFYFKHLFLFLFTILCFFTILFHSLLSKIKIYFTTVRQRHVHLCT